MFTPGRFLVDGTEKKGFSLGKAPRANMAPWALLPAGIVVGLVGGHADALVSLGCTGREVAFDYM